MTQHQLGESGESGEAQHAHYVRPENQQSTPPAPAHYTRWERVTRFFSGLLADRTPGDFNSLVPRGADGKRTRPFSFNGSGKGR